jgi:hypothetical protein
MVDILVIQQEQGRQQQQERCNIKIASNSRNVVTTGSSATAETL